MTQFEERRTGAVLGAGIALISFMAAARTAAQSPVVSPVVTANPDVAKAGQAKSGPSNRQFALKMEQIGTETDQDGTFPVYKMVPPRAGWAIKLLDADRAAVALQPAGLEVSWMDVQRSKDGKVTGRRKTVDTVPFDIATTTVTYTPQGTQWKDTKGHLFTLNRATSAEHPVEIDF